MPIFIGVKDKRYNVINTFEFILHFEIMKSLCHPFCKYEPSLKWGIPWFLQVWNSFTKKYIYLLTPWSRVLLEKLTASQQWRYSPHFMEPEISLPHSQVTATCLFPEPDRLIPCPTSHFLQFHLNITLPFTHGSSKWSLSLRFPHQNPVFVSTLRHTCEEVQ